LDIRTLRADLPRYAPIHPTTAVFLLFVGPALALLARRPTPRRQRILGWTCAGLAGIWAAIHLIEYVAASGFGQSAGIFSGLSALTAIPFETGNLIWYVLSIAMLAGAVFLLNTRRIHWFAELLVVAPLSISFLGLVLEAFRLIAGDAANLKPSGFPTVLALFVLELGLLFARPDRGWMAILTGNGLGGSLARRLLPVAVLVPFAMAWLLQIAQQAGLLNKDLSGVLFALSIIFIQSILIMWYATAVNRTDRKRKQAEEFVRSLLRVGAKLNSTLDVDALLDILTGEAINIAGAESGMAALRTSTGMVCRPYVQRGRPVPLPPGWTADHLTPFRTNEARNDPRIDAAVRGQFDVRSAVSMPILDARGDALGYFEVHNKLGGEFTAEDQERLAAVAQSAASAIQNALAYHHLREAEQALQSADRHKNEFLATLAHELRNPLAPLRNGLEIMRLPNRSPEMAERARDMMDRQLGQMVRLIDDLLDLNRIGRGRIELRREAADLAAVVRQAVETSRPLIEQSGHRLTIRVPRDPIHVDADVTRLIQVFANLLNNAAKFTEREGDIRLTLERQESTAVVCVSDTGVGIPAPMLARVFDMFTQVDRSLERSQGGLGIGLSLVRGGGQECGRRAGQRVHRAPAGGCVADRGATCRRPCCEPLRSPPRLGRGRQSGCSDEFGDDAGHHGERDADGPRRSGGTGTGRILPAAFHPARHRHADLERLRHGAAHPAGAVGPRRDPRRAHRLGAGRRQAAVPRGGVRPPRRQAGRTCRS